MIDLTSGAARELIGLDEASDQLLKGTIVTDDRRRRPLWFDGRFLDAAALSSEQNYFLGRQSDISRVAGVGVVSGLMVDNIDNKARTVSIETGHGITPAGELVVLPENLTVDLADVPEVQKLDASFGLSEIPRQASRNRSGLYVLALRPVEFTADPVASYPTSINGARSVEDGNIIEATAITLIPYPDQGARVELNQRRKYVAREIFIEESKKAQPVGVLPLAMIALNLGVIQWIDNFMVRREVGARDHDVFGLGLSPRALREAYLKQYFNQLSEHTESNVSGVSRFIAADYFAALPAAGPMPASAINTDDFTQAYFPSEMDVELSIIPEDELAALIEDSYSLPPVDLTLESDEFESTSILIVIPVNRTKVRQLSLSLKKLIKPLKSAAPGLIAKRSPIAALKQLSLRRIQGPADITDPAENIWRQTLQGVENLWYIRRRNISYREEIVADPVILNRQEEAIEDSVIELFKEMELTKAVGSIKRRATTAAEAELMRLFSSPVMLSGSKIAVKAAINEISDLQTLDRLSIMKVAERFTEPEFGEGIAKLEKLNPDIIKNKKFIDSLSASGKLPEIDRLVSSLIPQEVGRFTEELASVASSGAKSQPKKVATLITEKLKTIDSKSFTIDSRNKSAIKKIISGVAANTNKILQ